MYSKINYSPYYYLNSRHLNILDLRLMEKQMGKNYLKLVKTKINCLILLN